MKLRICNKRTGEEIAWFSLPNPITVKQLERMRNNVIKRFGRAVSVRIVL